MKFNYLRLNISCILNKPFFFLLISDYLGEYNKALEYNFLVLKIREKVVGKDHPSYAVSLNNIAFNYSK